MAHWQQEVQEAHIINMDFHEAYSYGYDQINVGPVRYNQGTDSDFILLNEDDDQGKTQDGFLNRVPDNEDEQASAIEIYCPTRGAPE